MQKLPLFLITLYKVLPYNSFHMFVDQSRVIVMCAVYQYAFCLQCFVFSLQCNTPSKRMTVIKIACSTNSNISTVYCCQLCTLIVVHQHSLWHFEIHLYAVPASRMCASLLGLHGIVRDKTGGEGTVLMFYTRTLCSVSLCTRLQPSVTGGWNHPWTNRSIFIFQQLHVSFAYIVTVLGPGVA
jgi:hypothetical protein